MVQNQNSNLGVISPATAEKALKIAKAVGQIIGRIFSAKKQAAQLNAQKAQYENALKVLRDSNAEADAAIESLASQISQLSGIGDSNLAGFGDWLKKTFTPKKYAESELNKTIKKFNATYPELEAALNQKLQLLQQMEGELKRLQIGPQSGTPVVLILGLVGLAVLAVLIIRNSGSEASSKQ